MKKSVILIKLGGSSITDKNIPYKAKKNVISNLAREFKKADKKYSYIIAHGSGSFGHTSASKFGGKKGYKSKIGIATVAKDATWINQIFTQIFVEENIPIISLSPRSMIVSDNGKLSDQFFQVLDEVMSQDLIPVVYGDVIWDKDWDSTIFSGEKVLSEIAVYVLKIGLKFDKVIEVGETNGLLNKDGETIDLINNENWKRNKKNVFVAENDVTGGMMHKIEEALKLSRLGIKTILISHENNDLLNAIDNKKIKGTSIYD